MMSGKKAYIKIIAPEGTASLYASGAKRITSERSIKRLKQFSGKHWVEFVEATLSIAGSGVPDDSRQEEEWVISVLNSEAESSVNLMVLQFEIAMREVIKDSQECFAEVYQVDEDCFYLEYDPLEWFIHPHPAASGHRPFNHFTSGCLFALAWNGLLEDYGFQVEGTGLDKIISPSES